MNSKKSFTIPLPPGIFGIIWISIVFLKIAGDINWSWWFIMSPVIFGSGISLYYFIKNKEK